MQSLVQYLCNPGAKLFVFVLFFVFFCRDSVPKAEEGAVTPGGGGSSRMRFFSMKRTASQHSFDTTSVDGSGPEDGLSVDSDGSDGFVMLTDSGNQGPAVCSSPLISHQLAVLWLMLCSYRTPCAAHPF